MKQWECIVCGWVYDEKVGDPDSGIAPGTKFEDIPDDWMCPECGVGKGDFELLEVADSPAVSPSIQHQVAPAHAPQTAGAMIEPIVIVGTGLAGYGLLKELRKLGSQSPIIMISKDDGRAYSKPALSTGYTKGTSDQDLTQATAAQMASQYRATVLSFTSVTSIDTETQTLSLAHCDGDAGTIVYGKLVLALGAQCIQAPVAGNAIDQIYSINDLADFARFQQVAKVSKAKRVCVIGAGLIGCEYANDLLNGGFEVSLIDPMPSCLSSLLPIEAGQALQRGLESAGAQFHFGAVANEVNSSDHGVQVTLDDGSKIEADMVLSAIGVKPNVSLAAENDIEVNRGIRVDRLLQTSANNVYAIGDCAEVDGLVLVYIAPLIAGTRALAQTLSGNDTKVYYPAMPVAVKTPACPVVVCPPPADAIGEWNIVSNEGNSVVAEFENAQGEVFGFALTGDGVKEKSRLLGEVPDWLS